MSFFGTFFVKVKEGGDPQRALNMGEFVSSIIMIGASYFIIMWMLPASGGLKTRCMHGTDPEKGNHYTALGVFWATVIGLVGGVLVGLVTEHYTGMGKGLLIPSCGNLRPALLQISLRAWVLA